MSGFQSRRPAVSTGWLQVGASGGPTYGTGWAAWSDTTNELPAMKKTGTTVKVVGLLRRTSGAGVNALVLPVGARPTRTIWRWVNANGAAGVANCDTSGNLAVFSPAPVTGQFYSFDFEFDVDEP